VPSFGRLVSQLARFCTGIEIHPGAAVGRRCLIGHGARVVIGETAVIGDDVMLYHGVTLGGHGWWADAKGAKRHPAIGDNVTPGVRCGVLGTVVVGDDCRIGPHALVVDDVPARFVVVVARGHCVTLTRAREEELADEERLRAAWMTSETEEIPDDPA
jgi:serine O-acetyltransferase